MAREVHRTARASLTRLRAKACRLCGCPAGSATWRLALLAAVLLVVACGSDETPDASFTPAPDTPTQAAGYRIGETTAPLERYTDFTVTFLTVSASPVAVDGPYSGEEYYTFTALPDRKFLVLTFKLRNVGIRPATTPPLAGIAVTDRGFEFPSWNPPVGIHSEEYSPRLATAEEVQVMPAGASSFVDVFPEQESDVDSLAFEIPADQQAVSVNIGYVDKPLLLK